EGDELSPQMISAIASGNPLLVDKIQMDEDVKQLEAALRRHESAQLGYRDSVARLERQLRTSEGQLGDFNRDRETYEEHKDDPLKGGDAKFAEPEAGIRELQKAFARANDSYRAEYQDIDIGEYQGFTIVRQAKSGYKVLIGEGRNYPFNMAWMDVP